MFTKVGVFWVEKWLFLVVSQLAENQILARLRFKRALVRVQKGVSWTLKGHLLQGNWALIVS